MDALKQGWFSELGSMWPGQAFSVEVEEVLYDKQSEYQHIQVFRSKTWGTVLALDGVFQCTERDEASYQEMMAHIPLMAHPNPKKVLIIGGGDGGVVREAVKHPSVESVTLCEIDKDVIEVSKKYLPCMAKGFDDPKANVYIGDGLEFMRHHKGEFDVIITDSSDPVGPAEALFTESYYTLLRDALRPGGIVCSQGESIWLHLDLIKDMLTFNRRLYPTVSYAYTSIPSYPSGQIGFILCSTDGQLDLANPRTLTSEEARAMGLRYYNTAIHKAAFVLPQFAVDALATSQ
eukprot:comp21708_c0_seq1/m.30647 comp21708_c0_seq1/g.30647  ORF comp21708_c0_seq1/g.30647 comp21708_c0_seq1/m.30647 type:complete len:290 (-) comp21708_c0_seq1:345-1214(-)